MTGRRLLLVTATCVLSLAVAVARGAEERLVVARLEQPVEILRDRWGIAHIYARTEHDLFFAQGFNAARDRLFQLELWRRQATGTSGSCTGSVVATTPRISASADARRSICIDVWRSENDTNR